MDFDRFKNYLLSKQNSKNFGISGGPQVGFKVMFCEERNEITVRVIGTKDLPATFGHFKPTGYAVKVTCFPEKEKYETKCFSHTRSTINEEFKFKLNQLKSAKIKDHFKGRFVSLTVYAVLEDYSNRTVAKSKSKLKRIFSFNEIDLRSRREDNNTPKMNRRSLNMNSRRTLGAVTYNLDKGTFNQKIGDKVISTPDIWREVKEISSGVPTQSREGKKGNVEVTLQYGVSEDGTNDVVEVSVTKFRCNLQTMQEHEKLGGQMYIKISVSECDEVVHKMKSDKFDPTLSLKIEENTTLRATINNYNLKNITILIRLMCKNLLGKKHLVGRIEMNSQSDIWEKIIKSPCVPITRIMNFE